MPQQSNSRKTEKASPRHEKEGRPAFADTQRQEVLGMLRAAGPEGISRATLIFEKHITQCGARVDELKRQGYVIDSESRQGEKYVRYVLKSEPLELGPPDGVDWYKNATGKPRAKEPGSPGPLFPREGGE